MHNDGGDDDGDDDDLVGGGSDGQDMQSLRPNWFSQCTSKLTALSFLAHVFVSYQEPSVVIHFFSTNMIHSLTYYRFWEMMMFVVLVTSEAWTCPMWLILK